MSLRLRAGLLLLAVLSAAPACVRADTNAQTQSWIALASEGLDARARAALDQIQGAERRLLALRAYLRSGDSLAERWTWSDQRLSSYASTSEGRAAAADLDAVSAVFARENPGYALQVNRVLRSFQQQLERWNGNPGVAQVAITLQQALRSQFGNTEAPDSAVLRRALIDWRPGTAAPLAAPGLSPHGQGRAFDFQVYSRERLIAGTSVSSAPRDWDAAGWTSRLRRAVNDSGRPFVGPLRSPYEPWHYAYEPRP
jgi:hypothetical protein